MNIQKSGIDYAKFLSRHDMIWEHMPTAWDQAPMLGNGILGAMIYQSNETCLKVDMGHSLVYDHRELEAEDMKNFRMSADILFARGRLPVGHFILQFSEEITGCGMYLDLYNAQLLGKDLMCFSGIVHSDEMLMMLQFEHNSILPESVSFIPAAAESPRQTFGKQLNDPARISSNYRENPAPRIRQKGELGVCVQALDGGWRTVTAWRWMETAHGMLLAATVSHGQEDTLEETACALLLQLMDERLAHLRCGHRSWWNNFYTKSFLSIPDTVLESFYWIQLYKLASAVRPTGPILDNQGPWLQVTPWPGVWWNLNLQFAYSPVFPANHCDMFDSVWQTICRHEQNLVENVAPEFRGDSAAIGTSSDYALHSVVKIPGIDRDGLVEIGNLTWALHSYWQYYRMTMEDNFLRDILYPLLKKSISFMLHFIFKEDGKWHIMPTASPEYGTVAQDTNYDISLLRWGLETLLWIDTHLELHEETASHWLDVLMKLADYPEDAQEGFLIAKDVPYRKSHRHASHIMMAYPLYLVNREQPGAKERIVRTVEHWQDLPEELAGFSCTWSASLYAAVGEGNKALRHLRKLWKYLRYNTLYREAGPVMETPLAAARSILDMLLQSWGGKIHLFPAMPDNWKDAAFENLRAEGAFLVSAARKDGKTQFARIRSLKGEPCVLKGGWKEFRQKDSTFQITCLSDDEWLIPLKVGEEIILYSNDYTGDFAISALDADPDHCNSYGLNKRTEQLIVNDFTFINW